MNLFGRLFLLFVLVPILELVLLIQLGRVVGLLPTVGLVLLTGAAGAWLARAEGVRVFFRFQSELSGGQLPGQALFDGLCVLVGGAFLLTPGVLTDLVGFALLVPFSRRWIQQRMRRSLERQIEQGTIRVVTFGGRQGFASGFGGAPGSHAGDGVEPIVGDLDPSKGIEVPLDER
jgi:UPF0716 protein FxsA